MDPMLLRWLHHLCTRLLWLRLLVTSWITPMNLLQLVVWGSSRRWLREKGREGPSLFNLVLTTLATLLFLTISSRSDPDKGRGPSWCWIIVIYVCSPLIRGGCWMRFWPMRAPESTFSRTLVLWDLPRLAITATCSWWRRWTISSWSSQDPWRHTDPYPVANGTQPQVKCYRMMHFSRSGGLWCGTTLRLGSISRSSWRGTSLFIWSWGAIAPTRTCLSKSTTWQTTSCGSYRRRPLSPHAWSPCSRVGECVPAHGKLVAGSMLSRKVG